MTKLFLNLHNITFVYDSAIEPLFEGFSASLAAGWTGVVGANGSGKTTLLKLASGILEPTEGTIDLPHKTIYCPQRTDDKPALFDEMNSSTSREAIIQRSQLGVQPDWGERWNTLSHGERKRAQIAVALWQNPDVLAIDEPTNHLDAEARELILFALQSYAGVGLLVSHDRELLDTLCYQCVFIDPPDVTIRPGGYSRGAEAAEIERHTAKKEYVQQKRSYAKLKREVNRRKEQAMRSDKRKSKRGIAKKDHSAKAKIDMARFSGKDGVAGRLQKQLDGRLARAREGIEKIQIKKDHTLGIWLPGSVSSRSFLVELPAESVQLGEDGRLSHPDLVVAATDRVALTGPNGAGKSTLIRKIVSSLHVPKDQVTYIPQEIELGESQKILADVQALPGEQLGHLMTIISRLGSRPHRLLESTEPSPGETRKLLLALGMTRAPHIIIMDEPTNHMDLPSIECLENALAECPGSLLLVSHDTRFLDKLTTIHWEIATNGENQRDFILHVS